MLRSIGKQPGESVESVMKKKRKATAGRICRKERFQAWNERVRGDGILIIIKSINASSLMTTYSLRIQKSVVLACLFSEFTGNVTTGDN